MQLVDRELGKIFHYFLNFLQKIQEEWGKRADPGGGWFPAGGVPGDYVHGVQ